MTFRRVTLEQDVDQEVQAITHKLFSSVRLPDMVEKLGGIQWLDATVAVILRKMTLEAKLSIIMRGTQALNGLTDRFVHLWLTRVSPEEKAILERTLKEAHIMY